MSDLPQHQGKHVFVVDVLYVATNPSRAVPLLTEKARVSVGAPRCLFCWLPWAPTLGVSCAGLRAEISAPICGAVKPEETVGGLGEPLQPLVCTEDYGHPSVIVNADGVMWHRNGELHTEWPEPADVVGVAR